MFYSKLILNVKLFRDLFRTLSNISDGVFWQKYFRAEAVNYFCKKTSIIDVDSILNTSLLFYLILSWRRSLSYRNQSKDMDLRHKKVNLLISIIASRKRSTNDPSVMQQSKLSSSNPSLHEKGKTHSQSASMVIDGSWMEDVMKEYSNVAGNRSVAFQLLQLFSGVFLILNIYDGTFCESR